MFIRNKKNYSYLDHSFRKAGKIRHYQKYLGKIPGMDWEKYQKLRQLVRRFANKHNVDWISREASVIILDAQFYGAEIDVVPKKKGLWHWWKGTSTIKGSWDRQVSNEMGEWMEVSERRIRSAKWKYENTMPKELHEKLYRKRVWAGIRRKAKKYELPFEKFLEIKGLDDLSWEKLELRFFEWERPYMEKLWRDSVMSINGIVHEKENLTILGLPKGSTLEEVKSRFRKLTQEHHPDHGGDPEIFMEIKDAYESLKIVMERR